MFDNVRDEALTLQELSGLTDALLGLNLLHGVHIGDECTVVFATQNPPRVENTEARPPLKRWAYFFEDSCNGADYGGAASRVCLHPAIPAFFDHRVDVHQRHPYGTVREPFPQ